MLNLDAGSGPWVWRALVYKFSLSDNIHKYQQKSKEKPGSGYVEIQDMRSSIRDCCWIRPLLPWRISNSSFSKLNTSLPTHYSCCLLTSTQGACWNCCHVHHTPCNLQKWPDFHIAMKDYFAARMLLAALRRPNRILKLTFNFLSSDYHYPLLYFYIIQIQSGTAREESVFTATDWNILCQYNLPFRYVDISYLKVVSPCSNCLFLMCFCLSWVTATIWIGNWLPACLAASDVYEEYCKSTIIYCKRNYLLHVCLVIH